MILDLGAIIVTRSIHLSIKMATTDLKSQDYDENIIKAWNDLKIKPTCIVFDLDYTLWPYLIDVDLIPPFKQKFVNKRPILIDKTNKQILPFENVTLILKTLHEVCFKSSPAKHFLAIASKATVYELALQLIDFFDWTKYFDSFQIHAGTKQIHMKAIFNELKLTDFRQILFFDDTRRNIKETEDVGVTGHYLNRNRGLTIVEFIKALKKHELRQQLILMQNK